MGSSENRRNVLRQNNCAKHVVLQARLSLSARESGLRNYRTWWGRKVSFIYAHNVCPRSTHTLVWVGWIAEALRRLHLGTEWHTHWVCYPTCECPGTSLKQNTRHHANHALSRTKPNVIPLVPQGHFIQQFTIKQCGVCLHWRLLVTKCYWEILTSLYKHSSGGMDVYHSNYCTLNPQLPTHVSLHSPSHH